MNIGKARQARQLLIEARVMLHRARAERIDSGIDCVVLPGKPYVMAHCLRLAQARKPRRLLPLERAEPVFERHGLVEIHSGIFRAADFEDEALLDLETAVAGESFNLMRLSAAGFKCRLLTHQHVSAPLRAFTKAARSVSVLTSVEAVRMRSSRPLSGKSRETGTPPITPAPAIRSMTCAALPATLMVNSLKNISLRTLAPFTSEIRLARLTALT